LDALQLTRQRLATDVALNDMLPVSTGPTRELFTPGDNNGLRMGRGSPKGQYYCSTGVVLTHPKGKSWSCIWSSIVFPLVSFSFSFPHLFIFYAREWPKVVYLLRRIHWQHKWAAGGCGLKGAWHYGSNILFSMRAVEINCDNLPAEWVEWNFFHCHCKIKRGPRNKSKTFPRVCQCGHCNLKYN